MTITNRTKRVILAILGACFLLLGCNSNSNSQKIAEHQHQKISSHQYPFNDSKLSFEARADDLVSRLTLDEKISQMFDKSPAIERLGIPAYKWWNEALHGVARAGKATVFPQAIGLAATFDEPLILKVATAISDEGRAKHHAFLKEGNRAMYTGLTYWSPNINIFRDPRWGRGQETYGEDPYLTQRIATNFVNGLQGNDDKYLKSVATIKHFAVHSGPEFSRHSDDYHISAKDLRETYLSAFEHVIHNTHVSSVMCAYNRVDGEPACGSEALLKEHLRDQFHFNGYVVSDCGAIADFYDKNSHHVVTSPAKAAAKAVLAGTDLNCGDHHGNTFAALKLAVSQGLISENKINQAVKRLFLARLKLGMFDADEQVPFAQIGIENVGSAKHLSLTEKAAEQSLVLLKNDGILPLKSNTHIALIGPNADNLSVLVGNYHGKPVSPISPKQALVNMVGENNVEYAVGSSLTGEVYTHHQAVSPNIFYHQDDEGNIKPGLKAEYFDAAHFEVQPLFKRIDKNIDFKFKHSPIDGLNNHEFSIKWQGIFIPTKTATYEFKSKNVSFTLDGKTVEGSMKLMANKQYAFTAKSSIIHYWHTNVIEPKIQLAWLNKDIDLTEEALSAAEKSEVIVFVGGISPNLEGEEMPLEIDGFSHGDRTHLNLPNSQLTLLKKLAKTGKPIIVVNFSGSAIALNWADRHAAAVVQAFYPGEKAGTALSRLLLGQFSPSGRLPITFYHSVDDLPDFKNYAMENRTYKYYQGKVLYPFGYGLSYADFSYDNAVVSSLENGGIIVSANIKNSASIDGNEIVQVYIAMPDAPVKTPIRQLAAFKHINVKGNSQQRVALTILKEQLTYVDNDGNIQPYKGRLEVSIGSGQGIKFATNKVLKSSINL